MPASAGSSERILPLNPREGYPVLNGFEQDRDVSKDSQQYFDVAAAVAAFHGAFGLPVKKSPGVKIDHDLARLRVDLLEEEVGEFVTASQKEDLIGIADALADIVYVVYGTALTYGIDLDSVLQEVHRSNMSKLSDDGKPLLRSDGKVIKSGHYFPPDISSVLSTQSH
jgi:predicted HAD superfamily Cof-like phosphohydrolase